MPADPLLETRPRQEITILCNKYTTPPMKYILLLLFYLLPALAYPQRFAISNARQNILYVGIPNPLEVAVEGYKCKSLTVTTDRGTIEAFQDECGYMVNVDTPVKTNITITDKRSKRKIGVMEFRVKHLPDPIALVGTKHGGDIKKNILKVQLGVVAELWGFDFDARFIVTGFTVTILRESNCIFRKQCTGTMFPPEVTVAFGSLETDDVVIFSGMTYKGAAINGRLAPIEFRIIE